MSRPASILQLALVLSTPAWPAPAVPWTLKIKHLVEMSPDGQVALDVEVPVLAGHPGSKVQDRINRTLRGASGWADRRRQLQELRREYQVSRQQDPDAGTHDPRPFTYNVKTTLAVGVAGPDRISVCFQSGGHHWPMATGLAEWKACTLDARTGRALGLEDLFGRDWRDRLTPLLRAALQARAQELPLFEDWQAQLQQAEIGFYLKPGAVVFFFPRAGIAAGYAGVVPLELPLDQVKPSLPGA